MANLAVIATTVTTPATIAYRLFWGTDDVIGSGATGLDVETFSITESGGGESGSMRFRHQNTALGFALPGGAEIRLWQQATDTDLFRGRVEGRLLTQTLPSGASVDVRCIDTSAILDRSLVTGIAFPGGLSDQAIVQGLVGNFAGEPLYAQAFVLSTNTSMPAMTFGSQSLRAAIEQVAAAACGDGQGLRGFYVDVNRQVHYFLGDEGTAAPYVIHDAPTGGQKAAENLRLDYDDSNIVNAVYVRGGTAAASGWVVDGASVALYGQRNDELAVPDALTTAARDAYGAWYLATRSDPLARGSFSITNTTGWHAGQVLTITNAGLSLASATFYIISVTLFVFPATTIWHHAIVFGARPLQYARSARPVGAHV